MGILLAMTAPFMLAIVMPLVFKVIHWIEFRKTVGSGYPLKMIYTEDDLAAVRSTEVQRFMQMSNRITSAFFLIAVLCLVLLIIEMACYL